MWFTQSTKQRYQFIYIKMIVMAERFRWNEKESNVPSEWNQSVVKGFEQFESSSDFTDEITVCNVLRQLIPLTESGRFAKT